MLRITGATVAAVLALIPSFAVPAEATAGPARAARAATGVIEGRITDQTGAPADATVYAEAVDGSSESSAYTDLGDGRYRIENVEPGSYRIRLYDNLHGTQWVPGRETPDDARVFEVADGASVTVDEQWLPFGVVRVQVRDEATGKPVREPCVTVDSSPQSRQVCGAKGVVVVPDVPPGDWTVTASGGASYFPSEGRTVTVRRGRTARVAVTLRPGAAVVTKVVDRATGEPLDSICVSLVDAVWSGQTRPSLDGCSDETGRLEIGPFEDPWTVNLYAFQYRNPWEPPTELYGAQWVAEAGGGTGDQRDALAVAFVPGRTTRIPVIRMDRPGSLTGVVRDAATGQPIEDICAHPYAYRPGQGSNLGRHCTGTDGRYTIDDLGPYKWPVEFVTYWPTAYAWQWSGDVADRFAARYTQVGAGDPATVDAALVKGGAIAGTVTGGDGPIEYAGITAYNRTTRDQAAFGYVNSDRQGKFTLDGLRTQDVWLSFFGDGRSCWSSAGVTAGATTTVALDTIKTCATGPEGLGRSSDHPARFRGLPSGS
jgi:hypothetical protein